MNVGSLNTEEPKLDLVNDKVIESFRAIGFHYSFRLVPLYDLVIYGADGVNIICFYGQQLTRASCDLHNVQSY